MTHGVRFDIAGRSFGLTPGIGLKTRVDRWTLELWSLKRWTLKWGALKRWHHLHGVVVGWRSLHAVIARVSWAATPLQLCLGLICYLVVWFVHQAISKRAFTNKLRKIIQTQHGCGRTGHCPFMTMLLLEIIYKGGLT